MSSRQREERKGQEKRWELGVKKGHGGDGCPWRKPNQLGTGHGGGLGAHTSYPLPSGGGSLGIQDIKPSLQDQQQDWAGPEGADLLVPRGGLQPESALQHRAELPALSSHLHFLTSPDKVTIYPPGFQAVCTAQRCPFGWTRGGRGMQPGRFVQTQALRGPPRSLVW